MFNFLKRKFRNLKSGRCQDAEHAGDRNAKRSEWIVNRMSRKLQLNADQKPLLANLVTQGFDLRQQMKGQSPDLRAQASTWIEGDAFDANRMQALIDEKAQTLQSKSPELVSAMAAFFNSLNPEQQQKVRVRVDGHRNRFCRN
jgi:protein CpxP